ncbi:MAG: hypothetical protein J3K34DRAFT_456780 [Monoraphidium minutum]|nr:MAG: hypothetical protein J3K34DRAFT_456780 [Monoraphidium minutum]
MLATLGRLQPRAAGGPAMRRAHRPAAQQPSPQVRACCVQIKWLARARRRGDAARSGRAVHAPGLSVPALDTPALTGDPQQQQADLGPPGAPQPQPLPLPLRRHEHGNGLPARGQQQEQAAGGAAAAEPLSEQRLLEERRNSQRSAGTSGAGGAGGRAWRRGGGGLYVRERQQPHTAAQQHQGAGSLRQHGYGGSRSSGGGAVIWEVAVARESDGSASGAAHAPGADAAGTSHPRPDSNSSSSSGGGGGGHGHSNGNGTAVLESAPPHHQGAATWYELRALLDSQGGAVNHIHVAAMMTRLAELQRGAPARDDARGGGGARGAARRPRLFHQRRRQQQQEGTGPQEEGAAAASDSGAGAGRGGGGGNSGGSSGGGGVSGAEAMTPKDQQTEQQALVRLLMDLLDQMRPALTPRELPHVLSAAAALRRPPDRPWAVRMMTRAHHCISDFSAPSLALMIWAVGRMGMRTRPDWARRFLGALARRIRESDGGGGGGHDDGSGAAARGGGGSGGGAAGEATSDGSGGGAARRTESPRQMARALSLAMHGIGSVGLRPSDGWMAAWMAAVAARRRYLAPRDVVCLLVGLQRLRSFTPPAPWMAALLDHFTRPRQLAAATDWELATATWALAKLGAAPPPRLLAAASRRLAGMAPRPQATLLYAIALARGGGAAAAAAHQQQQQQQRTEEAGAPPDAAAAAPRAPPGPRALPPGWLPAYEAASAPNLAALDSRGLATTVYAFALLRHLPAPQWRAAFAAAALRRRWGGGVEPEAWHMLSEASQLLQWQLPPALLAGGAPGGGAAAGGARGGGQRPKRRQQQQHPQEQRQQQRQRPGTAAPPGQRRGAAAAAAAGHSERQRP